MGLPVIQRGPFGAELYGATTVAGREARGMDAGHREGVSGWGYRLAHGRAVNCGWQVSRNRFHRLWQKHHLQQPLRVPQRKILTGARLDPQPLMRNPVWCDDFVHDRDAAGRMIRCLAVKDEATAYALAIVPALKYSAEDVQRVLERLVKG